MSDVVVTGNPAENCFEARIDGELAGVAEYTRTDGLVVCMDTEVYVTFEGKGVGSALARFGLHAVRDEGTHEVMPLCPFIKGWIERHRDDVPLV